MKNKDKEARLAEARAIARRLRANIGDKDVTDELFEYSFDEDWEVRKAVAEAMAYAHPDEMVRFIALKDDSNAWVRNAALDAYRQIGVAFGRERRRRADEAAEGLEIEAFRDKYGAKAAQEASRAYRKALKRQIAGVGHDLRNVVSPLGEDIEGTLALLDEGLSADAACRIKKMMLDGRDSVKMLARMAEDIRDFTREISCDARMCVHVLEIVREAWAIASGRLSALGLDMDRVAFTADIPDDLSVSVVKERMSRVFQNILKNAAEALMVSPTAFKEGGKVTVTAHGEPDGVAVVFSDNGRGMGEKELAAVRRFVPTGISSKPDGTGFGMGIAYEIVSGHGGSIDVASGKGKGTDVTVFLPREAAL